MIFCSRSVYGKQCQEHAAEVGEELMPALMGSTALVCSHAKMLICLFWFVFDASLSKQDLTTSQ